MDSVLWVAETALIQMRELAKRYTPLETGGILLGYQADNLQVVVTAIIGPGPNARHRRFRFRPDYDDQQCRLEEHFMRTEGRETYLGDWHTHPFGACALSMRDKHVLGRIARTSSSGTTQPLMVVLADGDPDWDIHAARFIAFRKGVFCKSADLLQLEPQIF